MGKNLSTIQENLLLLLKEHVQDPLTIRDLQDALGMSSTSLVYHHIKQLEKKGYLRRNPSNSQDYQVLHDDPNKKIAYVNLYGMAQCGPNGNILDGNPIDSIPIASKILGFNAEEAFMVKAKGDSMHPKIKAGDLVIAKKSSIANEGDMVVCVNNEEVLIKYYRPQSDGTIILASENKDFAPFIAADDFSIQGIIRGVYGYTS